MINFTYKDCKTEDFEADASFSQAEFETKLLPLFDLDIQLDRINIVFTSGKGNRFMCHIECVVKSKSIDVVEEGYEPSQVVRIAIKQATRVLRGLKEKLKGL